MALITEPIIVVCDEILVFETLFHAASYIEPWDTEDCTAAYDSEGRLLRVFQSSKLEERGPSGIPEAPAWLPDIVRRYVQLYMERQYQYTERQLADWKVTKIEALEQVPTHQSELREVLTDWLASTYAQLYELKRIDAPVSREELLRESLGQLVSRGLKYKTR